ncbi:hypothetical protein OG689_05310 [Kitasatospora sp. NBC_00240]|uniref:hypothetical protein n=1 Tax=Kitasatospora sp. NBC_00240 TaxID=2903567 RepID=UPI0022545524|nr:hypothetical protein [Kitasatospora sp. NBC_00240]MCX5208716.1 hypothetical protein [Kitasatospora sp. NBC_00240]
MTSPYSDDPLPQAPPGGPPAHNVNGSRPNAGRPAAGGGLTSGGEVASGGPATGGAWQPARAPSASSLGPAGGNVLWAFAPWIVFAAVAGPSTWKLAAVAGLVTSLLLNGPDVLRGRPKLLEIVGILFFAVICLLALVLDRDDLIWLETYAQVIANGVVAVAALGSLAFVPFTEQYARESTPPEIWRTAAFKRTNRVLTAMWGGIFAVIALLGLLALHVSSGTDWLNWVLPVVLLVVGVKVTRWYPEQVRARAVRERLR